MKESQPHVAELDRTAQVSRVIEQVLERRAAGEDVVDESICQEHSSLLPELAEELRKVRLIERARQEAQQADSHSAAGGTHETTAYVPSRKLPPRVACALGIRCPLCHEPMEIAADQPADNIHCTACGRRFSLAGDDPNLKVQESVTRIGHFELQHRLGMGSFGTVWKALDTKLDRAVALKIPRDWQLSDADVDEFLHEARVAAKLRHPHIVSVLEIGRDGDIVYIISDLVEGLSLDKFKETKRLTHREAAELLATIAGALDFAHRAGIVHRDLKPGNILVDSASQPHITDFGLAKRIRDEVEITSQGEILGTPAYMSPEQARGEAHLADCRTDLYSLGVMLFELLTDFLPFQGNVMMLVHHTIHTEPPRPRSLNGCVPRDLEVICLKCLEKDRHMRYASAKDLADELHRFLAGEPILARPISRVERLWRWCRREPTMALSAVIILSLLLFIAGASVWGYAHERANRLEKDRLLASERAFRQRQDRLLAFINHSEDVQRHQDAVEAAAIELAAGATAEELRTARELKAWPRLQSWAVERYRQSDRKVFAWFVLDSQGTQVARGPIAETIGRNYARRSYFHGLAADLAAGTRPPANQHITQTHHSTDFETEATKQWVVTVTTPIVREGRFLGVVGIMLLLSEQ